MIVTAGAIDCHVHFICPQLAYEAISSGEPPNWESAAEIYEHINAYILICVCVCINWQLKCR